MTSMPIDSMERIRRSVNALLREKRLRDPVHIMEICGTHTMSIARSGMREQFGEHLRMISGPGCPVCVTDQGTIDGVVALALDHPEVTLATYGDMIRVPGTLGNLSDARARGAQVEVVYSVQHALKLAAARPEREVVFLGIGFETTTPASALAIRAAKSEGLANFSLLCSHKRILPAMEVLLKLPDIRIDAFLCPGHVSVVLGWKIYDDLARRFAKPCVVAGFEPDNIVRGILAILEQVEKGDPRAASVYPVVTPTGNAVAQRLVEEFFEVSDARWRGLGVIPDSGWRLRDEFAELDATRRFDVEFPEHPEPPGCRCAEVITGRCLPTECELFARRCTPLTAVGPCMVSSEGSCAAYFRYQAPASR